MIRSIAEYLITQPGLTDLVVGSNVWVGPVAEAQLADLPDRLVVLIERPGPAAIAATGDVGQMRLQAFVRHTTIFKARDLAVAVHKALHEIWNRNFAIRNAADAITGTMEVWSILGEEPASIGVDARGRYDFSSNYVITYSKP